MCDYSLHAVAKRPANVGDQLIISRFPGTDTRGFAEIGKPSVAVCLMPGTELAFEDMQNALSFMQRLMEALVLLAKLPRITHRVGRFRQINLNVQAAHHDAVEFPDGRIVLVTQLRAGLKATVLQLPVLARAMPERNDMPRQNAGAQA